MSVSKLIKSPALIVETPVTEKVFTVFSTISSIVTTPEIGVCVPTVLAALEINSLLLYWRNEYVWSIIFV